MSDWTHRSVCEECTPPGDADNWKGTIRTSETHARITAETHDRRNHGGSETAEVVEVSR